MPDWLRLLAVGISLLVALGASGLTVYFLWHFLKAGGAQLHFGTSKMPDDWKDDG